MSMSTWIEAFKPPGEKWARMRAVWDACMEAGVEVPPEVDGYFEGMAPDPAGVEIQDFRNSPAVSGWKDGMRQGFEVDVTKLPKDVTVIRFYNSW